MTNKFKIGDLVRVPTIDIKRDENGQPVKKWNPMIRAYIDVETKVWSEYTCEVVAAPDGKRKRYQVKYPSGDVSSYSEKSLARA